MINFSKKRLVITLGLSIGVWYGSVILQGVAGYNAPFNLLLSEPCKLTGFPVATCLYANSGTVSVWIVNLINILFWFWVIHLLWGFFGKGGMKSKNS